jgi:hypothetical protein
MADTRSTLTGGAGRAGHGGSLPVEAQPAHDEFVINSERRYARYRSYQQLRNDWQRDPKDKDVVLRSTKREFGEPMVVPIAFRAVETMVPRVLASTRG